MTNNSIAGVILRKSTIALSVVLSVSCSIAVLLVASYLANSYDQSLLTKANVLTTLVKEYPNRIGETIEFDFADEFMPEFQLEVNPEYFQIRRDPNTLIERSHSLKAGELPQVATSEEGYGFRNITLPDGRQGRLIQIYFTPQIQEKALRTPENLRAQKKMTLTIARERESLNRSIFGVTIFFVAGAILILLISRQLIRHSVIRGMKPLNSLQNQLSKLDADNLQQRIHLERPPSELKLLISQFNDLVNRLQSSFDRERRFSGDVAHELRTPIAEIRNLAEVALRWPVTPVESEEYFSDILSACSNMQHIVNNLLALAKCEDGNLVLDYVELNLSEQIKVNVQRLTKTAELREVSFRVAAPDLCTILTSQPEIELVLHNLLSNAVSYCPPGDVIDISLSQSEQFFELIIKNHSHDIREEDLQVMFERMWRREKSRSSEEHAGLGLSLVAAYATLLNMKVSVSLEEDSTIAFCVSGITGEA